MNGLYPKKTKEIVLLEAFKLFSSVPYNIATYSMLEQQMELSRGSVAYYFKNKKELFLAVIKEYVFKESLKSSVHYGSNDVLLYFFRTFVKQCKNQKEKMQRLGIPNISLAYINLEMQAVYFHKGIRQIAQNWLRQECEIMENMLKYSIKIKEIKNTINPQVMSRVIFHNYLGAFYSGMFSDTGYDIDAFEEGLLEIYNLMKNDVL